MNTLARALGLGLFLGLTTGCGTLINISSDKAIYGGVSIDLENAANPPLPQDEGGWFWSFDLPFSALADTALLPIYGVRAIFVALTPYIDPGKPEDRGLIDPRKGRPGASDPPSRTPPPRLRPPREDDAVEPL